MIIIFQQWAIQSKAKEESVLNLIHLKHILESERKNESKLNYSSSSFFSLICIHLLPSSSSSKIRSGNNIKSSKESVPGDSCFIYAQAKEETTFHNMLQSILFFHHQEMPKKPRLLSLCLIDNLK